MMFKATFLPILLLLALHSGASAATPAFTNHLAGQKSPYLLQHAHNPVDWYPWGEEAFARARQENKPIFLSVGYSTCHWCHVMERESFENPAIAKILNDHFISIKVDREERPDLDSVYMTFIQATTGSGGWPMSVFLTPELKPFFGGTYFPPVDAYGRPGFKSVLQQVAAAWQKDEKKIRTQAGEITSKLQSFTAGESDSADLDVSLLTAGFEQLQSGFDAKEGGFRPAPKFPRPSEILFLFHEASRLGMDSKTGQRAVEMAVFTLEKLARGGIHDQLGGGFHRYSTDDRWLVPHFEKMLYDQAQLAEAYLVAYQITGRADFAATARDILDYVLRDMTSPEGGFYSAEDADSVVRAGFKEKSEGAFYVWNAEEIQSALGPEAAPSFLYVYGIEPSGNAGAGELAGKNILSQTRTIADAAKKFSLSEDAMRQQLADSRARLLDLRAKRPRPHRDNKILTAWNGLMISSLAKAYQVLGDEKYLLAARRAADFLRTNLYDPKTHTLTRAWLDGATDIHGFVEDYAFLIRGLIDLYQSDFNTAHLAWSVDLQKRQNDLFWDTKAGGYYSSTGNDPNVLLRMKETSDGAEPSPNAVAALNLMHLSHLLAIPDWDTQARATLDMLAGTIKSSPLASPTALIALDTQLSPSSQIVIAGPRDAAGTQKMLSEIWKTFLPGTVWALLANDTDRKFFAAHAEFYAGVREIKNQPTAFICRNFACNFPTTDMATFEEELSSLREPANTLPSASSSSLWQ